MRSLPFHLEGEVACPGGPCIVKSHVQEGVGPREGSVYGEVQCIMDKGHMRTPCEQADTTENITFRQLCWRLVMTIFSNLTPGMEGPLEIQGKCDQVFTRLFVEENRIYLFMHNRYIIPKLHFSVVHCYDSIAHLNN